MSERIRRPGPSRGWWPLRLGFGALAVGGATIAVPAGSAGAATVEVLPGQTLSQLAEAYGTPVSTLAATNGIANPNLIVAGTFLVIPTATGSATSSSPPSGGSSAAAPSSPSVATTSTSTSDGTSVLV
ncbi:MAG TPA: LysM domain-containing protein, partial [Acidimicrobiales bacterium]|nr:LysM domain-containing protein [Acidimicrobiales bacterium]